MKSTKLFGALGLLLAMTLVGCNGNSSSAAPSSSTTPSSSAAPSSSVAPSSSAAPSSSSQAPAGPALKTWAGADTKAGMSNGGNTEIKDETGDVQFVAYKLGTANDTVTFTWTPTAEQAGKVAFKLCFTTKATNSTKATFWKQSDTSDNDKMSIAVDGNAIDAPEAELRYTFEDICGGADAVVDSDGVDGGNALANPVEYKMAEFNVTAGVANSIVVTYHGGGYSFYIVGASVYKA